MKDSNRFICSPDRLRRYDRHLLYHGKKHMQAWGLIVLLVSRAAGQTVAIDEAEIKDGITNSQRVLAEVTEMIRISHLVHQGLVNLQPLTQAGKDLSMHGDMTFGNKIALLSGDYLLGQSCEELASLRFVYFFNFVPFKLKFNSTHRNQYLVELISSAVRDLAESEFIGDRDEQNNALPSKPNPLRRDTAGGTELDQLDDAHWVLTDVLKPLDKDASMGIPEKEWELRNLLSAGSLLGKSCQGAMQLGGHPHALQRRGYLFGKHLSLAWQACLDAEPFLTKQLSAGSTFNLVSAPVLFHLEHDPAAYADIETGYVSVENVDYDKLHRAIRAGPALERTRELQRTHSLAAMTMLSKYPESDARTALQNIIMAMQEM